MTQEYGYLGAVDVGTGRVPNLQSNGEPIYTTSAENRWARELQSDDGAWRFLKGGYASGRGNNNALDDILSDNFTILTLIRPVGGGDFKSVVSKGSYGTTEWFGVYASGSAGTGGGFNVKHGASSGAQFYATGMRNANTWEWVSASRLGSACVVYCNGKKFTATDTTSSSIGNTYALTLSTSDGAHLSATLIYNRVLTDTEVSNIMLGKVMPKEVSGLVGYYKFNESHGNASGQCTDYSGQGNHLTYSGAVWERFAPLDTSKTNLLSGQPYIARRSPTEPIPPRLDLNLTSALDPRITVSRADATPCATYFGSDGLMKTAAANIPRFDYDPVTLTPKGLLIEESRTNLLTYSGNPYTNGTLSGATKTLASGSYLGLFADGAVVASSGADWHRLRIGGLISWTSGQTYAVTAYLSAGTSGKFIIYLRDNTAATNTTVVCTFPSAPGGLASAAGSVSSIAMTQVGTGYKVTFLFTPNSSPVSQGELSVGPYSNTSGQDVVVHGAQIELGSFPTSYIPTTTAAVTRAADSASMTGTNFSNWWNATEGTFLVVGDVTSLGATVVRRFTSVVGTGAFDTAINTASQIQIKSGATFGNVSSAKSANTTIKVAGGYSSSASCAADGAMIAGTIADVPSANVSLWIGSVAGSSGLLNGHISRIVYWPKRLPDTTLQTLTSGAIPENSTYYPTLNWWERRPPAIADPERMGCLHNAAQTTLASANSLFALNGDFTFDVWIRSIGSPTAQKSILYGWGSQYIGTNFLYSPSSSVLKVIYGDNVTSGGSSINFNGFTPNLLQGNVFRKLTATRSGSTYTAYINSVQVAQTTGTPAVTASCPSGSHHIGGGVALRSLRLFSRALSAAEVNELFLTDKITNRTGLVGEWLCNTPHSTTITDTSGNGLNTTTSNPLLLDSPYRVNRRKRFGKQLKRTGSQWAYHSSTALNNAIIGAQQITIAYWIKTNRLNNSISAYCGLYTSSGNTLLLLSNTSGKVLGVLARESQVASAQSISSTVRDVDLYSKWTLLSAEVDYPNDLLRIYMNGKLVAQGSAAFAGSSYADVGNVQIRIDGGSGETNAYDDFRIYNRALTAQEHYSLYLDQAPRNGLVAEYKFDSDTTNCKDTSGNGFDATWSGITLANYVQEL